MPLKRRSKKLGGRPCHYCKRIMTESKIAMTLAERSLSATIDHMIPKDAGGTNDPYNLVIACARCNGIKASLPYEAFVEFSRTVIQKFPDATTPVLRRAMNIYIMHLVESAMTKQTEVRRALSLSLLRMAEELEYNNHVSTVGKSSIIPTKGKDNAR